MERATDDKAAAPAQMANGVRPPLVLADGEPARAPLPRSVPAVYTCAEQLHEPQLLDEPPVSDAETTT
eukprot:13633712-Alexandrium_andersonii.AAC.1